MSDPIDNDYTSVTALTPEQRLQGLTRLVRISERAAPMDGALGLTELIDACGLTDVANEVLALKGLPPLREVSSGSLGRRDSTGRLRTAQTEARPIPDGAKEEVLCRCPGRKHVLTAVTSESTLVDKRGQRQCRVGMERRKQAGMPEPAHYPAGVELKEGERWCQCTTPHILTPHESETTSIDKHGHRRCKAGKLASNRASRPHRGQL